MPLTAIVRAIAGKQLEARVGKHRITTDRSAEEGGTDLGTTSGGLFLAAVGSCATGGVRNFLQAQNLSIEGLQTEVTFVPSDVPGARDRIRVEITLPPDAGRFSDGAIRDAATQGRVVSRVRLGSEVDILVHRRSAEEA